MKVWLMLLRVEESAELKRWSNIWRMSPLRSSQKCWKKHNGKPYGPGDFSPRREKTLFLISTSVTTISRIDGLDIFLGRTWAQSKFTRGYLGLLNKDEKYCSIDLQITSGESEWVPLISREEMELNLLLPFAILWKKEVLRSHSLSHCTLDLCFQYNSCSSRIVWCFLLSSCFLTHNSGEIGLDSA